MAETQNNEALDLKVWERNYFKEFVRENGFTAHMGEGPTNPIVVKKNLIPGGKEVTIPLVSTLAPGSTGTGTLVGNEKEMNAYDYTAKPYWHRQAVAVDKEEEHKSAITLLKAAKEMLKQDDIDEFRYDIIDALSVVANDSSKYNAKTGHGHQATYAEASAAQRNTYCAANATRLLFGDDVANYNATMGTALGTITSAMTVGAEELLLMKRIAKARVRSSTNPRPSIRPIRAGKDGREYFCVFAPSNNFTNLKTDEKIYNANKDARIRGVGDNPIFQDGDLIYDGLIIKEVPEISSLGAVGASNQNVSPLYLLGAQALGVAWGQMSKATRRKEDDYGFIKGVGVESKYSAEKLFFNGLQHGMVTGYFAADEDLV